MSMPNPAQPDLAHQILKKYWGYDSFRPLQADIVASVLAQNDTLALLPTGGGKSVCFQVPGLVLNGLCLVISPLIALMKDQVEQLQKRHIQAECLVSGMTQRESDWILDNAQNGKLKFLYVSPERLRGREFQERLKYTNIGLLAIDEAHCISQWGYDFRPAYLHIAHLRTLVPQAPCVALTATATNTVRADIAQKLAFKPNYRVFTKSFARANLSYSAIKTDNKTDKLLQILRSVPGTSVVYVRNRRRTAEIANFLSQQKINADFYHAGLTQKERNHKQSSWINNQIRVIVATNAFGMGIDKPDVRTVIHLDTPDCLEAYYQEAGRAGRDEKKAYAVLLFDELDMRDSTKNIERSFPDPDYIIEVYQKLANYFQIAVGDGQNAVFDFDIDQFIKNFALDKNAFYALKTLEEQGYIQLNDAYHNPSKLLFTANEAELYRFQVANSKLDPLIKMLLRLYGGALYSHATVIQEDKLAQVLKTDFPTVKNVLLYMAQHNICIYSPQNNSPQLIWQHPRFAEGRLPLKSDFLRQRKQLAIEKIEAMTAYCQSQTICRTSLILNYFDEPNDTRCGVCDNCLSEKKKIGQDLAQRIIEVLTEQPNLSYSELCEALMQYDKQVLSPLLRRLIDEKKLVFENNLFRLKTQ